MPTQLWAAILLLVFIHSCCFAQIPPYVEKYFDQKLDHFNFKSYSNLTFRQRYLIQDKWWNVGKGPIFFYTGNEGDITDFWAATGLVHEWASWFGALILFAEHRYYGKSLPFGDKSFDGANIGLLTMDQALADYALLLTEMKKQMNANDVPVVAFGGSYGGMLSAYMRFKYPNIITAALAASAPIYMLDPDYDRNFFFSLVTKDFFEAGTDCLEKIRAGFQAMDLLVKEGKPGLDKLTSDFKLCSPLADGGAAYKHLQGWIRNGFTYLAMLDYPYPTDFMGLNLPPNPVNTACSIIGNQSDSILGLAAAAGVFYPMDSSPLGPCHNISADFIECADPTGCGTGPNALAWDYQACTEITLPSGSNGVTDMFPVLPFTPEIRRDYCMKRWGVVPSETWSGVEFWGKNIASSSYIIFSNGDLDPWRGGGVTQSLSDNLVALTVKGGAHHLDLRGSNKLDPPGVIQVREAEQFLIRLWINNTTKP